MTETEKLIVDACARAFFVSTWADAEEEAGRTYPGQDVMDVAPETPSYARDEALLFLGRVEQANGVGLLVLLGYAARADGQGLNGAGHWPERYVRDFGHYLGMQGLGHGVSWFDSHARFDLKVPHTEFYLE